VFLIGLVALTADRDKLPFGLRLLLVLIMAGVVLAMLQLVPLPPQLWTQLPGRAVIEDGYAALGPLPWLPISLTPHATLNALFFGLPFIAVLLGTTLVRQIDLRWIVAAMVVGTLAGVVLGAVQSAGGEEWKIYSITNSGAVGFFANRNFFGSLLVLNIPFAAALMSLDQKTDKQAVLTSRLIGVGYLLVIACGIVLNRSLAATLIAVPVSIASLALLPFRLSWRWYAAAVGIMSAMAAAFMLTSD
jgi:hypothetical protein